MKRLILIALFALILVFALTLISCSEKEEAKDTQDDTQNTENTDVEELFLQSREDCEFYFFSYYAKEGFGSYTFAFPSAWIERAASDNSMTRSEFDAKIEAGCEKMASSRKAFYGEGYEIAWETKSEKTIQTEALDTLKKEMTAYSVPEETVLEALEVEYVLTYFEDSTKDKTLSQASVTVTLIKIADEGWVVSPSNYLPVEF